MSRKGCKRVSFSPDPEANDEPIYPIHSGRRRRVVMGIFSFDVRSSPGAKKLLRRIGDRVAKTMSLMSFERKSSNAKTTPSSSRNVSSASSLSASSSSSSSYSSSSINLMKSKSLNESESHRAEAIEDCIKFLNSSFSLSRSNSTSTWSC